MISAWLDLLLAGILEVVWSTCLKESHGFSSLPWSVATIAGMLASFWFLAHAVKVLPLGTSYVIWTGIGAVGPSSAASSSSTNPSPSRGASSPASSSAASSASSSPPEKKENSSAKFPRARENRMSIRERACARHKILMGMSGKEIFSCGPASHEKSRCYKGAVKRRHKSSTGMRERERPLCGLASV